VSTGAALTETQKARKKLFSGLLAFRGISRRDNGTNRRANRKSWLDVEKRREKLGLHSFVLKLEEEELRRNEKKGGKKTGGSQWET